MVKHIIAFFLLITLAGCLNMQLAAQSKPESNSGYLATAWYQKSAEMKACYLQTYRFATQQLDVNLKQYSGAKKPAVVLDIDETVLDNSPYQVWLIQNNATYSNQTWQQWTAKACAKALPGAVEFTKYAKQNGVEVFYITNRHSAEREATLHNLDALGFPNADTIHILLKTNTSDKTARRDLVNQQHEILLYLGDNLTDFSQIYAHRDSTLAINLYLADSTLWGTRYIVFPNPMYGEWESAIRQNKVVLVGF